VDAVDFAAAAISAVVADEKVTLAAPVADRHPTGNPIAAGGALGRLGCAAMTDQEIRLYGIPLSHPVLAVREMLERKGLEYRYVELLAGTHPAALWALGFRRATVPAMRLPGGRRVQGSLAIAQALEQIAPTPSLYPADHAARTAAESAERWGEAVLQPIPRRLIRWGLRRHLRQRQWFARVASPLPAPAVAGWLLTPIVPLFVYQAHATDDRVRQDLAELPAVLDRVDQLLETGVIGGEDVGAADLQIASSVRMLLAMEDVNRFVAGRRAQAFALKVLPEYPCVPAALPPNWLQLRPTAAGS
jgi:glutathione S-transferase